MSHPDPQQAPVSSSGASVDVAPSWKPLYWFVGILATLILLWEFFLELFLDIIEHVWLILIEAPEELLEDLLTEWLKQHFPHDADYYAEITTAIGLTPLKLLLVVVLARWFWRHGRSTLFPRWLAFIRGQAGQVRQAWHELTWTHRILAGTALVAVLVVLMEIHIELGLVLFAVMSMAALLVAFI